MKPYTNPSPPIPSFTRVRLTCIDCSADYCVIVPPGTSGPLRCRGCTQEREWRRQALDAMLRGLTDGG